MNHGIIWEKHPEIEFQTPKGATVSAAGTISSNLAVNQHDFKDGILEPSPRIACANNGHIRGMMAPKGRKRVDFILLPKTWHRVFSSLTNEC